MPVVAAVLLFGASHVFVDIGLFFSKLAVVSFGGAYALLAYMAQQAVDSYHWMSAPEMVDGLGLAETTPGPLILVTQFVGFLAAYRDAAPLSPGESAPVGRARRDHRRRGRRDPQPDRVVRAARAVRGGARGARRPAALV
jgi:chromate transporter